MRRNISNFLIALNLGAAFCILMSLNSGITNHSESRVTAPHERLLNEQRRVESEYLIYLDQLKQTVKSVYLSKDVQKLRRANLRKKYFHQRKADASQFTLRYAAYTAKQNGSDLVVRPVYESFKSKLFWDKLLKMMARQAFISTAEMKAKLHSSGDEKFTEIISIFLKDAGLNNLEYPGNFNRFSMLGEDILLYWDIIYKKCSPAMRKKSDRTKCVKGIFTAEIDRRNSVRDFAMKWHDNSDNANEISIEFGQLERRSDHSFIEAYWPLNQHSSAVLGENISRYIEDRGSRFFRDSNQLALIRKSQVLPNTVLVSKIKTSNTSNLPYSLISLLLLLSSILISLYFKNRY